jgi:hypothetical protein
MWKIQIIQYIKNIKNQSDMWKIQIIQYIKNIYKYAKLSFQE